MDHVYSLGEAMEWFLAQSSGSVVCVDNEDKSRFKECVSFMEAEAFYQGLE